MISQREIKKSYEKMLEQVKNEPDNENKINSYRCSECGHFTNTVDVDSGTTPFIHDCEKCKGTAYSEMYNVSQDVAPTQEWYRPTLKKCLKLRKKEHGEVILNHVFKGGLENRKIKR